jgi:hypothetical protein
MKQEFDVFYYRQLEETYNEKLKYVNQCIWKVEKISIKQTISELKFIRLQIREYCSLSQVLIPQNIPTGKKGLTVTDASIYNYVINKINYYSELEKINIKPIIEGNKKEVTFENLFKDPDIAKRVKGIFERMGYTLNGKWQGLSGFKGELLSAYYVLKPLLKPHKVTPIATIFYTEFGLKVGRKNEGGYISPDMLRKEPFNNDRDEFVKIFSSLFNQGLIK